MVRPERIELSVDQNVVGLKAVIKSSIFMGDLTRYTVQLLDGKKLDIDQPNTRGQIDFDNGARISLVWDEGDAVVVP